MKRQKKASGGLPWGLQYAKKEEELNDGDTVTIINEGMETEGNYGPQFVIGIKLDNGEERAMSLNQTTENNLIEAFGEDSLGWAKKKVNVFLQKKKIGGKRVTVAYLAAPGWEMDDFGEFVRNGDQGAGKDEIPTIPYDEDVSLPDEEN